MQQAFDTIAEEYDASFTFSIIGKAQRQIVWGYLEKILPVDKNLNILELNCGTGEDALWFGKQGHKVLATDISDEMLTITRKKIENAGLASHIEILKLDINKIEHLDVKEKFDVVFSNFGGMNCISPDEMQKLPFKIKEILNHKGRIIMVIMPSFCLWESIYFLSKMQISKVFRRFYNAGSVANLNNAEIRIFYYSPSKMKKIFVNFFNSMATKPVGFFLPPSYLENFFKKNQKVFSMLNRLENLVRNKKYFSGFSDHYLIDFQMKFK